MSKTVCNKKQRNKELDIRIANVHVNSLIYMNYKTTKGNNNVQDLFTAMEKWQIRHMK
jgi:hypothetical protein